MAVLTGSNGQLKYEGTPVAKCRDWSISVTADGLETTCLAGYDRTYVKGLRGTTGSATLLYDPTDKSGVDLLNSIFLDENDTDNLQFVLDRADGTQFDCEGFLTSVSPSISVGAVQAVSVSFQVSGKPTGLF